MNSEISITIDKDGNFNIEVLNGHGKSCQDLTRPFEEGLGVVSDKKFKPEYHNDNQQIQKRHISI